MPEGDTVWRQAQALHRALAGRTVTRASLRFPQVAEVDLTGLPIHGALARGKNILLRVGDVTVHSHLKMDGLWQLYGQGTDGRWERWRQPADQVRAIIEASPRRDQTGLVAGSQPVQAVGFLLGLLDVFPSSAEESKLGHLGPDLLSPAWSDQLAQQAVTNLLARPDRPIGPALLDQGNLAGIGTIYRAETLFLTGIHPQTPVAAVPNLTALVQTAHLLLDANRNRPLRVTRTNDQPLWCYGRAGKPCYRCGAAIILEDLSEQGVGADRYAAGHLLARPEDTDRISFRCPNCQPLLG